MREMEKYIKPAIKVKEVGGNEILAASGIGGTTGLDNQPGIGGDNDGSHSVGAKQSIWDNDEK